MGQRRSENILVSIEPGLRVLLEQRMIEEDLTASSWFRKIAIEELKRRKLLTDELLTKITIG